mgnify:CR=1 FL=1
MPKGRKPARGFWASTPAGRYVHISGDPGMSQAMLDKLINLMDKAYDQVVEHMDKPTVCVDFNGCLDLYTGWVKDGMGTEYPPREGAAEFLEALHSKYKVFILSSIQPMDIQVWLDKNGMGQWVDDVTKIKPPAIAYIDDRGITFKGDFGDVLRQLEDFKPHWR